MASLNARYRRAIKARGHFPSEQTALKCLYLVTRSLDPTGAGQARWAVRWKPALNAFSITFGDRFPAAETYSPTPETPLTRQSQWGSSHLSGGATEGRRGVAARLGGQPRDGGCQIVAPFVVQGVGLDLEGL